MLWILEEERRSMNDTELKSTQDALLLAAEIVSRLDLDGLRYRIVLAQGEGSLADREGEALKWIDEVAAAAIEVKGAYQRLRSALTRGKDQGQKGEA
jgi:hypothetical protein